MIRRFHLILMLAFLSALAGPALADGGVRIVVPARDIPRGEIITDSDLTYATVALTWP